MSDKIEFRVCDPHEAREDWAIQFFPESSLECLRIMINGRDFIDIVNDTEQEKCGVKYGYGHPQIGYVTYDLKDSQGEDGCTERELMPFCCIGCGDQGCCTFRGKWHEEDGYVVWHGFSSNALDDYGLEFRFEKEDYYRKIDRIEKMAG